MTDISNELYKSKKQINYPLEWIPNLRERIVQFYITFYFCYFLNFLYPHKSFDIDSFFLQILWKVLYTRPDNAWKQLL